ncbi:hypothetical protein Smlt0510A [Stenotrophomonas maltophilia K279a]|uniref:Uncharacterized protein n=1 Tax=Stenotrophomonas maltophilia (strain K279a) TaxID=522373 RepID=B2FKY2_STRMK|nr:hypothetical protein Smlt0510A [Stenotrophomonas maltophilia K279a]
MLPMLRIARVMGADVVGKMHASETVSSPPQNACLTTPKWLLRTIARTVANCRSATSNVLRAIVRRTMTVPYPAPSAALAATKATRNMARTCRMPEGRFERIEECLKRCR